METLDGTTHWTCEKRLQRDGGNAQCCDCVPHGHCGRIGEKTETKTMKNTHHCETCTCGRFVPKLEEGYFLVSTQGNINESIWENIDLDFIRFKFGNVFRTKEAARKALEAITKVLREAGKG